MYTIYIYTWKNKKKSEPPTSHTVVLQYVKVAQLIPSPFAPVGHHLQDPGGSNLRIE